MKTICLMIPIAVLLAANLMGAQRTPSRWHSVQGQVIDDAGRPAAMATVYLRDAGGHRLRMKQTDASGRFNFSLVNTDNKYEIYSEKANLASEKLPVIASESRREVVFRLVLKNARAAPARSATDKNSHATR
jgi:Carboxypeptidase regulatory-like domain